MSAPVAGRRRPAQSIGAGLERFAARQTTHRGRSHAAILIGVADIARGIRRQAARVRAQQRPFDFEGVAEPFEYLAIDGKWGARRDHDGIEVVLLASDVDPAAITLRAARQRPASWCSSTLSSVSRHDEPRPRAPRSALSLRSTVEASISTSSGLNEHFAGAKSS